MNYLTELNSKTEELLDKVEESNTLIHDIRKLCEKSIAELEAQL